MNREYENKSVGILEKPGKLEVDGSYASKEEKEKVERIIKDIKDSRINGLPRNLLKATYFLGNVLGIDYDIAYKAAHQEAMKKKELYELALKALKNMNNLEGIPESDENLLKKKNLN